MKGNFSARLILAVLTAAALAGLWALCAAPQKAAEAPPPAVRHDYRLNPEGFIALQFEGRAGGAVLSEDEKASGSFPLAGGEPPAKVAASLSGGRLALVISGGPYDGDSSFTFERKGAARAELMFRDIDGDGRLEILAALVEGRTISIKDFGPVYWVDGVSLKCVICGPREPNEAGGEIASNAPIAIEPAPSGGPDIIRVDGMTYYRLADGALTLGSR